MIVALFLLVVVLAAALLVAGALFARSVRSTTIMFLVHLRTMESEARAERALLLRAVLARHGGEFGMLDRIRQQETKTDLSGVKMTPEQYRDWLEDDIRGGLGGIEDSDVPLVPEGLSG